MCDNKNVKAMIPSTYFIHPEDEKALAAMKKIPGFDALMRKIMEYGFEKYLHGVNMASSMRLSEAQDPKGYYLRVKGICDRLGLDCPEVYLETNPFPNAYTYGDTRVCMVLTSGLFDYLTDDEVDSVIAHECGHIICHHVLYHTLARTLLNGLSTFMKTLAAPLVYPLYYWYRKSELSADRVATLLCGPDTVARAQLRLAGGPKSLAGEVNIDEWVRQAEEYEAIRSGGVWDRFLQMVAAMDQDHPFAAVRVREARNWSRTEGYRLAAGLLSGKVAICPVCHQAVDPGWAFCRHCGSRL